MTFDNSVKYILSANSSSSETSDHKSKTSSKLRNQNEKLS